MARIALSPAAAAALYPDPILSANLYGSGRLCEVIAHLVAPFWKQYRRLSAEPGSYLWLLGYARCGEHLKLRLHGPDFQSPLLRELLAAAQESYFARCAPPAAAKRVSAPTAPPIDAEDRAALDYPDRHFFGRAMAGIRFRSAFAPTSRTTAMPRSSPPAWQRHRGRPGASCERSGWQVSLPDPEIPLPARSRPHRPPRVPLSPDDRLLYLLYHRDCLLRYLRKQRHWTDGTAVMARLIARFEQRVDGLPLQGQELTQAAADSWDENSAPTSNVGLAGWLRR